MCTLCMMVIKETVSRCTTIQLGMGPEGICTAVYAIVNVLVNVKLFRLIDP